MYQYIMDSFDFLPLACVINSKFLALHGGLSPEMSCVEDINKIQWIWEPPKNGILLDILWSDPIENNNGKSNVPFL